MFTQSKSLEDDQGMTPHHIRQFNRRLVLKLLYQHKDLRKSELAKLTQLSIPAVTNILDSLDHEGWIEQHNHQRPLRGKSKGTFRVSKSRCDTICIYISPKQLRAIIVDNEIRPISSMVCHKIEPQTPESMLEDIIAIIVDIRQSVDVRPYRLALACHGQVDTLSGTSLHMSQVPWKEGIELKYLLEQRLGVDVLIDNDCVMIALAEKWISKIQQGDYCILNVDYGIGSSFLIGNEIYRGRHFRSGQIGHTIVAPDGELCGCGRRGCLETLASLKAIENTYNQYNSASYASFLDILHRYHEGEPLAEQIVSKTAIVIGQSLYNFLVTLDINQIILYGASCQFGDKWLKIISNQTLANPFEPDSSLKNDQTLIRFGKLNDEELLVGISYLWVEKELENLR
ncbi:ROK family transcriptional regulator [Vibrio mimicus]